MSSSMIWRLEMEDKYVACVQTIPLDEKVADYTP